LFVVSPWASGMCKKSSNSDTQWHNTQLPKAFQKEESKKDEEDLEREGEKEEKGERGWSVRVREEGMLCITGCLVEISL